MDALDGKFTGVIHKVKDGSFVPPDEWMVFLIKDAALLPMLEFFRNLCLGVAPGPGAGVCAATLDVALARIRKVSPADRAAQSDAVDRCIKRVRAWQGAHPDRVKGAGVELGERLQG